MNPGSGESVLELAERILACRRCHAEGFLPAGVLPVATPVPGARVMVVGQAPGRLTNERRYHFAGPGGKVLETWLQRAGFPPGFFRTGCFLTSLTHCFPGNAPGGGDRRPGPRELERCRPWLEESLRLVQPDIVLLVGKMAIDTWLGRRPLSQTVGQLFEQDGRVLVPLPHPSGVSRWLNQPANRALLDQALTRLGEAARARLGPGGWAHPGPVSPSPGPHPSALSPATER